LKGKAKYNDLAKIACFVKKIKNFFFGINSSWSELVSTRRSIVLNLPFRVSALSCLLGRKRGKSTLNLCKTTEGEHRFKVHLRGKSFLLLATLTVPKLALGP